MASVKGPLFSIDARGSIGKAIHYMKTPHGHKVCRYSIPIDRHSVAQLEHRQLFAYAVAGWQGLTDEEKAVYNSFVKDNSLHMSGFNYYCSVYSIPITPPTLSPVLDGLTLWYKFDEGSGDTVHDSIGSNHAVLHGSGQTWIDGLLNSAWSCNASAGLHASAPTFTTRPASVEIWLKMPAGTGPYRVFHNVKTVQPWYDNPLIQYYAPFGGFHTAMGSGAPYGMHAYTPDNVNYKQIVFTLAADGYHHIYVDGVLDDTSSGGQPWTGAFEATEFNLGVYHFGTNDWSHYFTGAFCSFRVYNKVLSTDDMLQNYNYEKQ